VFVSTEDELVEQCDATASPNSVSPYKTGDLDVDPIYPLSDDSYSGTSDSNSSSLHEVSVCALNETQNVDLTTERKQEPKGREQKRTV
jgi:hypothetical protein